MIPDAKWLDALKLPLKAKVAIALTCGILFFLFRTRTLSLGKVDPFINTGLLIAVVVFGVLAAVDGIVWLAHPITERRRSTVLSARRATRRAEQDEQRELLRAAVIAQLDHLSRREMQIIAKALDDNSPTFYTYVHSPAVTMLQGKHLAWTPGGPHHRDHYPFTITDYVWDELLKRRDEFLAKETAFKKAESG